MNDYHHVMRRRNQSLKAMVAALIFLGTVVNATAGDLGVTGNAVTVSNAGGGAFGSKSIGSDGIVATVSGIPTAGPLDFPTFAFTLEKNATFPANGTFTFQGGFIIDDENSERRVEISIPTITMTFASGVLTGSVSASQSVTVLGRSATGAVQAVATISNNLGSFNGSTLSFNADNQLAKIAAAGGILGDIITTINTASSSHYAYAVFLKQTSGPENVRFTRDATLTTPTPFPCSDGTPFILNSSSLASAFSGAYALQGKFDFTGGSGSYTTTLSAFNSSCAVFGSTTTTTTPSTTQAATNAITSVVIPTSGPIPATSIVQLETAITGATTLATQIATGLTNNSTTVTVNQGLDVLGTLNTALDVSGSVISRGGVLSPTTVSNVLNTIDTVLTALSTKTLTATEVSAAQSLIVSTLSALINTVPANSSPATTENLLAQVSSLLSKVSSLPNSSITASLAAGAKSISLTTMNQSAASLNQKIGKPPGSTFTFPSGESTSNRPRSTFSFLSLTTTLCPRGFVYLTTTKVCRASAGFTYGIESPFQFALKFDNDSAGAGTNQAAATLATFTNLSEYIVGTSSGTVNAEQSLIKSLGGAGSTVSYDSAGNMLLVNTAGLRIPTYVSRVTLVPDGVFPLGITVLPDGSALSVSTDGFGVRLVPASRDPVRFIAALEAMNISVTISAEGVLTLVTNTGQRFSGTFGFDHVATGTLGAAPVTFTAPSGNPASTSYVYRARYSDGSTQNIQPYIDTPNFLDSAAALGVFPLMDRSTGVITIAGGVRLRPDYFVTPLTGNEVTFYNANKDSFGIAYRRALDFNNDGILDYEIMTATTVQRVYVLP